jgi:hypothetical protein
MGLDEFFNQTTKIRVPPPPEGVTETFEEILTRISAPYNRRYIGFPCDKCQGLPIEERGDHMFSGDETYKCPECKRLIDKLNREVLR